VPAMVKEAHVAEWQCKTGVHIDQDFNHLLGYFIMNSKNQVAKIKIKS
jgi:hypothetical protein